MWLPQGPQGLWNIPPFRYQGSALSLRLHSFLLKWEATQNVLEIMNPVYSPGSSGVPYTNAKGIGYTAGFPMGYTAAAPAYSPNMYPGANPTFQTGISSCELHSVVLLLGSWASFTQTGH
uniref:Family with sequence similarity 168 member B n=1 Tax=Oryctolagus cuniculus TaxID=9986 RepID=A0A5F9DKP8_RABIT